MTIAANPSATNGASFTTAIEVDRTPEDVFAAINDVRAWWTGDIEGVTDRPGGKFTYRYEDMHRSTQQIVELVPGRRVVWLVTDASLNFVRDKTEWNGTRIVFDIAPKGSGAELRFTHEGLTSGFECFEDCSGAWAFYINGSLRRLIETGSVTTPGT